MTTGSPILLALRRRPSSHVPIWLMRQAGRYLPEYRALRDRGGSFLDFCLSPDLAVEATLQPLRRFPLDAAIIFSDILVVPHALGQTVAFEEGRGPRLEPLRRADDLTRLSIDRLAQILAPVETAIRTVRLELAGQTALFGFAGAPWTVASYMIEGGSSSDFVSVKSWAYREPESFQALIDLLVEATSQYLCRQAEAGADVLQLFDSWAGILPAAALERWCLEPTMEIVNRVKVAHPKVPIVVFPRGIGASYLRYADACGADGLSLDTTVPTEWAATQLQSRCTLQGNLDPLLLVTGGDAMRDAAEQILERLAGGPFIFNLGHGIVPQTPPDHVAELCEIVHGWSRG